MHHSILSLPHHVNLLIHLTLIHSHPHSGQCIVPCPSVVTKNTKPPWYTWTLQISSGDMEPEPSDDQDSYEDKDFPTVPRDDELWTTELAPERTFLHTQNGLSNNVCSYPCPYRSNNTVSYIDSLDLSDVSDLEDHFLTTSDEEGIARD